MSARFKFGRRRPAIGAPKLALGNYLLATLPDPPPSINYGVKGRPFINQMFMNDVEGDCVQAALCKNIGITNANAGRKLVIPDITAQNAYSAMTGFVPNSDPNANNPTDNGTDEVSAFNYMVATGIPVAGVAHKIIGYVSIDATNLKEVLTALFLFENVTPALELPQAYVDMMPTMKDGFVWKVAGPPDPNNGHFTLSCGYETTGSLIDCTWGMYGSMLPEALAMYCVPSAGGDLHAMLTADVLDTLSQKAPNGLDITQLIADLQAIGHGAIS